MMQREFPYDAYAAREDQLRAAGLPAISGCRPGTMRAVLLEIARYPESWQTQKTIAANTGFSRATVQRTIEALTQLDLITTERKWCGPARQVRNFHRVNWEEVRRLRTASGRLTPAARPAVDAEQCDARDEQSAAGSYDAEQAGAKPHGEADQSLMVRPTKASWRGRPKPHGEADQSLMVRHKQQEVHTEETTTRDVVVEAEKFLAKGAKAVAAARARGMADAWILERCREWRELPADRRLPGTLYNWLALDGSYTPPRPIEPPLGRGDGLSRDQVDAESVRFRIVRAGRAAGATPAEIERKLQAAGL